VRIDDWIDRKDEDVHSTDESVQKMVDEAINASPRRGMTTISRCGIKVAQIDPLPADSSREFSFLLLTAFMMSAILNENPERSNEAMRKQKLAKIGVITILATMCVAGILYASGTWNILQEQDPEIRDYFSIAYISSKEGWTVGVSAFDMDNPGFIGHTTDGGKTWEKAEIDVNQNLSNVFFFDKKNGWAVGSGGMIVGTKDGGKRWDLQTSKVGLDLYGLHFVNDKVGYAVGMGETIVQTKNGGKTWKIIRGGEGGGAVGDDDTSVFNAVHFLDESTGWIAGVKLSPSTGGQDGIIQKTMDGGQKWIDQPTGIEDIIKDIFFIDSSTGWAVAENGVILHTTNGGDSWKPQTSGTEEHLLSIRFADKKVGWAVGGALGVAVITHTADGGKTWEEQKIDDPIASKIPIRDVFIMEGKKVWATGNNGVVMEYK
jgi:photosystem II stability/assembly factor-like uncharacterized protein